MGEVIACPSTVVREPPLGSKVTEICFALSRKVTAMLVFTPSNLSAVEASAVAPP